MPKVGERRLAPSWNGDTMLVAALDYADRGHAVTPCDDKRPILTAWPETRLTREEVADAFPHGTLRNVGIVLNLGDLSDVECDSDEAEAALVKMFGGSIPPTPTWESRRGKHRLFKRPDGLPEKAVLKLDGIEFRGIGKESGACSVVPPSAGRSWLPGLSHDDVKPAELPPSIVARLVAKEAPAPAESNDIPEGERNDALFRIGCRLHDVGLTSAAVRAALRAENLARCKPPLPDDEVADIVRSVMKRDRSKGSKGSDDSDATILLEIAEPLELWHTKDDVAYATLARDGHREHWPVKSQSLKKWLSHEFYQLTKTAPRAQGLTDALMTLGGRAQFAGPEYPIAIRVAGEGDRIYLDLADERWRAIEIDAKGWRIVDDPPVRFRRAKAMLPLPEPLPGGSVADLRRFVNVSDLDWPLLLAWLVAAFRPVGPYPILKLLAEQGAGKTTTSRVLRSLIDPNSAPVRSPPREERDLAIAANNGRVTCFDNLSYVSPDLSDALCRLSTGGGFSTRTLYENDEETIFDATRPVILNGIEDMGTRSDLLDRALIVELPRIESKDRRPEKLFWEEFEEARPHILGALLDAVSAAIRNLPTVEEPEGGWPRMADFAMWAVAAEPALGLESGRFLEAYEVNRETANLVALESSPIVIALDDALRLNGFRLKGTATELLGVLGNGRETRAKGWPKTAKVLSGMLTRLAPNLRGSGIDAELRSEGRGNAKRKVWEIRGALGALEPPPPKTEPKSRLAKRVAELKSKKG
jgi:hypothetical protein